MVILLELYKLVLYLLVASRVALLGEPETRRPRPRGALQGPPANPRPYCCRTRASSALLIASTTASWVRASNLLSQVLTSPISLLPL